MLIRLFISIIRNRNTDWTIHIGALWFLTCLFITVVLFYFLITRLKTNLLISIALIMMFLLGYFIVGFWETIALDYRCRYLAVLFSVLDIFIKKTHRRT